MSTYAPIIMAITSLLAIIIILNRMYPNDTPVVINIQEPPAAVHPTRPHEVLDLLDSPEYRPPPIQRYYRPQAPQQVGILRSENGENDLRPIYSKPSRTHRDRFFYWTTGGNGHNNYSVPLTLGDRDCTDDLGCEEMYGNESVSVFDNPGVQYKSHVYRTDLFNF